MNFLDTYDITAGGSSTPPPNRPQQSLNEEVNQVIGQLGRFWGGFRKQSQTVLETARKDLGDVVAQAQKGLGQLAAPGTTPVAEGLTSEEDATRSGPEEDNEETTPISSSIATLKESDVATNPTTTGSSDSSATSTTNPWNTQALFSRLQSALPPNIVSTVQNNIPDSLRHASENIDIAQLRTNLFSEFQRIQGVTRAQAEEYAHKSEALLREAVKEAGEVLRDAVKVIPPEEANPTSVSSSSGLIWDGSDMWMLPAESDSGGAAPGGESKKGKNVESGIAAVATRAEALLRRLKHDPAIVRHDPGADGSTKETFTIWIEREVGSKEGGFEGEEWQARVAKALDDTSDGKALATLRDALVPSELTETEFWQRFFFRVHQIKEEEEKRKALLQVTTESEDDFDWDEDDSENEGHAKEESPKSTVPGPSKSSGTKNLALPPSTTTTRESSLDSFDVVSSTNASVSGEGQKQDAKNAEESDDDSDWE